jgi:NADH-quinone oxidoreductase subunit L
VQVVLASLGILSLIGGWLQTPHWLGNVHLMTDFLERALPAVKTIPARMEAEATVEILAAVVSLAGILIIYLAIRVWPQLTRSLAGSALGSATRRFWLGGWGFDWLYDALLVRPYAWAARVNKDDFIDLFYRAVAWANRVGYEGLSRLQTGQVRWYAVGMAFGAAVVIGMVVLL